MSAKSAVPSKMSPTLSMHRLQLNYRVYSNGVSEISAFEKLLDSKNHQELRGAWVIKNYGLLICNLLLTCYIDEK